MATIRNAENGLRIGSEVETESVLVRAIPQYQPEESQPEKGFYMFHYTIFILNRNPEPVQLLSRHWIIIDGDGNRQDVEGPGVVGQTPLLEPNQSYNYSSFCPLPTEFGTMEGFYHFRRPSGELFTAEIGRFYLTTDSADSRQESEQGLSSV